jgi:hypothetical protein
LKKYFLFFLFLPVSFYFAGCNKASGTADTHSLFDSAPLVKQLVPVVNEISGIADSKLNPGYLWAQEDSGNPPQLYLIGHDGTLRKKIYLKGLVNRDWEEMALFNNDMYIAETGDNAGVYTGYRFYRFPEPALSADTVYTIDTIRFTYPDGPHDCEAFVVEPATRNIYLITKRESQSRIYRLSYPYAADNTVSFAGTLPYTGVVGATLSENGKELILKTYSSLYYYAIGTGESLETALQKNYTALAYQVEPQGEAVSFAADGSGFYTISEKAFAPLVNMYFYKRK